MKPSVEDGSWIKDELSLADFSDERLKARFELLSHELASQPSQPINHASTDWAATKAAYRFFANEKVSPEKILSPHYMSTQFRTSGYSRIVAVQDTTYLDFSKHEKTSGLSRIGWSRNGEKEVLGLIMHTTMAMTERGLPLGLLDNTIWERKFHKVRRGHHLSKIPRDQRESFKWFRGLRAANDHRVDQEIVMVCDREGDVYELFQEGLETGIDLVVRMKHDRIIYDEELDYISISDKLSLEDYLKTKFKVEIPGSGRRKARQAELSIRFAPVIFSAHPRGVATSITKGRIDLELYAVELREVSPPQGVEPIVWYLVTTLEVNKNDDAIEVMQFYKLRWQIEQFFKCLKTGCNIESCRLNSRQKLANYISLMSVIAWRIMWMTHLRRCDPDLSCEVVFTQAEWKAAWLQRYKREIATGKRSRTPPVRPPPVSDVVTWIAMAGGFLGRKNDGEPGLITIWRGWLRLSSAVDIFELMNNEKPTSKDVGNS